MSALAIRLLLTKKTTVVTQHAHEIHRLKPLDVPVSKLMKTYANTLIKNTKLNLKKRFLHQFIKSEVYVYGTA